MSYMHSTITTAGLVAQRHHMLSLICTLDVHMHTMHAYMHKIVTGMKIPGVDTLGVHAHTVSHIGDETGLNERTNERTNEPITFT
jgi:hypothetical protein